MIQGTPPRRLRRAFRATTFAAVGVAAVGTLTIATPTASVPVARVTVPVARVTGDATVNGLIAQMTVHEEVGMLTGAPDPQQKGEAGYVPGVPRLGIPALRLADGQDGANSNTDTTVNGTA